MRGKWNSLRFRVLLSCVFSAIVIILVFLIYGAYNVIRYRQDFIDTNTIVVDFYSDEFNNDISSLNSYIDNILVNDNNFGLLNKRRLSEKNRIGAEYYLKNTIGSKAGSLGRSGGLFYYDGIRNSLRSTYSSHYEDDNRNRKYIINLTLGAWLETHADNDTAAIVAMDTEQYYVRVRGRGGYYIGYMLNLSRYFSEDMRGADYQLVFADRDGKVISEFGTPVISQDKIGQALDIKYTNGFNYIVVKAQTAIEPYIILVRPFWQFLRFWEDSRIFMFLIVIPCISIVPFILLYRYFRMILIIPTTRILGRIRGDAADTAASGQRGNIVELEEMEDKINEMIHTSNALQHSIYEAHLEEGRMRLQNYQLQLKPHFYLNCLKSMDAYLQNGDKTKVRAFIFQLADYLRMRFQDVPMTKKLKDELELVNAYYCLQTMLLEDPFLCTVTAGEAEKECLVPAFCIQALVENSVKYAIESGKILIVEIMARLMHEADTEYLLIKISDNGRGFAQEQLKAFNSEDISLKDNDSEHIGINNLRKRFNMLYGNQGKLVFYNTLAGGAVVELMIPMAPEVSENGCSLRI